MNKTRISRLASTTLALALILNGIPAAAGDCAGGAKATTAAATAEMPAITDLAAEAGFKTLSAALAAAGLQETLRGAGPFTVFAPTDEAFAKLPAGTLEALLADKEALTRVLLYHVASGELMARDVVGLDAARTLNGDEVSINAEDGVKINGASVIQADVRAANGVIHVIDQVLVPANL